MRPTSFRCVQKNQSRLTFALMLRRYTKGGRSTRLGRRRHGRLGLELTRPPQPWGSHVQLGNLNILFGRSPSNSRHPMETERELPASTMPLLGWDPAGVRSSFGTHRGFLSGDGAQHHGFADRGQCRTFNITADVLNSVSIVMETSLGFREIIRLGRYGSRAAATVTQIYLGPRARIRG
jgi:hypothetical protein